MLDGIIGKQRATKRRLIWMEMDGETGKLTGRALEPDGLDDREYLDVLHGLADRVGGDSFCYFIAASEGPVKIGYAINVERRLRDLQNACPIPLSPLAIVPGGELRERAYHYQFARFRLHGEWFERSPEIVSEIERIRATAPA